MWKFTVFIILSVLVSGGCQSKVTGRLEIDGSLFAVQQCRSGQAFNYSGIELTGADGRRLRLFANTDGTCTAALFKSNSPTGEAMGKCGTLRMETQSSRINSIYNVRGEASLACESGNHKIVGNIEFENCH